MEKKQYRVTLEMEAQDEANVYQLVERVVQDYRCAAFKIEEVALPAFKWINTGMPVTLRRLVESGDIQANGDNTVIQIFDEAGRFLMKGRWFEDHILGMINERGQRGVAWKTGTGLTVNFRFGHPADAGAGRPA